VAAQSPPVGEALDAGTGGARARGHVETVGSARQSGNIAELDPQDRPNPGAHWASGARWESRQWSKGAMPTLSHFARKMEALARSRIHSRPVISSSEAVLTLVARDMISLERETVRALFLNPRNFLIANETVAEGSVNRVELYPREVIRRALQHNATALILVHNHPSGDPFPSESDLKMTRVLQSVCNNLDLVLHDHIIVGMDGWFSFLANKII
jgi:DNA repair protein RadC